MYIVYTVYYIETCMEKVFHPPIGEILCIPLFSPLKYKAWLINEENPFITFFFFKKIKIIEIQTNFGL